MLYTSDFQHVKSVVTMWSVKNSIYDLVMYRISSSGASPWAVLSNRRSFG